MLNVLRTFTPFIWAKPVLLDFFTAKMGFVTITLRLSSHLMESVEAEPNFDIAKKWIEKFFSLD
jgi:hypothetical protein